MTNARYRRIEKDDPLIFGMMIHGFLISVATSERSPSFSYKPFQTVKSTEPTPTVSHWNMPHQDMII